MKCFPCEGLARNNKIDVLVVDPGKTVTRATPNTAPDEFSWTNPRNRYDVNNSGSVTPLDALLIINALDRGIVFDPLVEPDFFYDVNESRSVTALDALQVINYLNGQLSIGNDGESDIAPETLQKMMEGVRRQAAKLRNEPQIALQNAGGSGTGVRFEILWPQNTIGGEYRFALESTEWGSSVLSSPIVVPNSVYRSALSGDPNSAVYSIDMANVQQQILNATLSIWNNTPTFDNITAADVTVDQFVNQGFAWYSIRVDCAPPLGFCSATRDFNFITMRTFARNILRPQAQGYFAEQIFSFSAPGNSTTLGSTWTDDRRLTDGTLVFKFRSPNSLRTGDYNGFLPDLVVPWDMNFADFSTAVNNHLVADYGPEAAKIQNYTGTYLLNSKIGEHTLGIMVKEPIVNNLAVNKVNAELLSDFMFEIDGNNTIAADPVDETNYKSDFFYRECGGSGASTNTVIGCGPCSQGGGSSSSGGSSESNGSSESSGSNGGNTCANDFTETPLCGVAGVINPSGITSRQKFYAAEGVTFEWDMTNLASGDFVIEFSWNSGAQTSITAPIEIPNSRISSSPFNDYRSEDAIKSGDQQPNIFGIEFEQLAIDIREAIFTMFNTESTLPFISRQEIDVYNFHIATGISPFTYIIKWGVRINKYPIGGFDSIEVRTGNATNKVFFSRSYNSNQTITGTYVERWLRFPNGSTGTFDLIATIDKQFNVPDVISFASIPTNITLADLETLLNTQAFSQSGTGNTENAGDFLVVPGNNNVSTDTINSGALFGIIFRFTAPAQPVVREDEFIRIDASGMNDNIIHNWSNVIYNLQNCGVANGTVNGIIPATFNEFRIALNFEPTPSVPVNIYSVYVKYSLKETVNQSNTTEVFVPISQYLGASERECVDWGINAFNGSLNDDLNLAELQTTSLDVSENDRFIWSKYNYGTGEDFSAKLGFVFESPWDANPNKVINGDPALTLLPGQAGYKQSEIEKAELMILAGKPNNLEADSPVLERFFPVERRLYHPTGSQTTHSEFRTVVMVSRNSTGIHTQLTTTAITKFVDDLQTSLGTNSHVAVVEFGETSGGGAGTASQVLGFTALTNKSAIVAAIDSITSNNSDAKWGQIQGLDEARALFNSLGTTNARKLLISLSNEIETNQAKNERQPSNQNSWLNVASDFSNNGTDAILSMEDSTSPGMSLVLGASYGYGTTADYDDYLIKIAALIHAYNNVPYPDGDSLLIANPITCTDGITAPNNLVATLTTGNGTNISRWRLEIPSTNIISSEGNPYFWPYDYDNNDNNRLLRNIEIEGFTKSNGEIIGDWNNMPTIDFAQMGVELQEAGWITSCLPLGISEESGGGNDNGGIITDGCDLSDIEVSLTYNLFTRSPINIYAAAMKYVVRDFLNPSIRATITVPIENWNGLNLFYPQTPCSYWVSNTIPTQYSRYPAPTAGTVVNVAGVADFISPLFGLGGDPETIVASVPTHDADGVNGRVVSGDPRCTKTRSEPGYRSCVVESMEILLLAGLANNILADPPFIEQIFEEEIIFFDPGNCDNLDIIFAIDNSGSMGNVINNVKDSIDQLIDFVGQVSPESTIGLVRYGQGADNGNPDTLIGPTAVDTQSNRDSIRQAVLQYGVSGGREPHGAATNHSVQELIPVSAPDRSQVIILITDEPFSAGGETETQLNQAATNAADNDIVFFGLHVGNNSGDGANNIYQYLIDMAQIAAGAAVRQSDGIVVDPLIKLLSRFCLSAASTSSSEVLTPNQCSSLDNPNLLDVGLEFNSEAYANRQSFNYNLQSIEILQTVGDVDFWPYSPPANGLDYDTRPDGNWLNYPNVDRQGVEMQLARWEGFRIFTDLPDGTGVVQCTGINVRLIEGGGNITIPPIDIDGAGQIARCFTSIDVEVSQVGGEGQSTVQKILLDNASGGEWSIELSDFTSGVTTPDIAWDATAAQVQSALETVGQINGKVTVTGDNPEFVITFDADISPVSQLIPTNSLTCTDQDITIVPDGPYDYEVPKPGPNNNIDPPDTSCNFCEPISTETLNLKYEGISAGCDTQTRKIACRFTKIPGDYSYFLYKNGGLVSVSADYEAAPGDQIVLLNKSVKESKVLLDKVSRSFAKK